MSAVVDLPILKVEWERGCPRGEGVSELSAISLKESGAHTQKLLRMHLETARANFFLAKAMRISVMVVSFISATIAGLGDLDDLKWVIFTFTFIGGIIETLNEVLKPGEKLGIHKNLANSYQKLSSKINATWALSSEADVFTNIHAIGDELSRLTMLSVETGTDSSAPRNPLDIDGDNRPDFQPRPSTNPATAPSQ